MGEHSGVPPLNHRPPPRRISAASLLVAFLAVACLIAPRPHAGVGAVAAEQPASSPADTPVALLAYGGLQPALLPRAPADPPVRVILPLPPAGAAAVAEHGVARWFRGPQQAPPTRGGSPPASGFASSRLPTGPPPPA